MKIKDYKKIIKETAIFPRKVENFGMAYYLLGLIDEMGEVGEAIVRFKQNDSEENKVLLVSEFGDVVWYITGICEELKLNPELIFNYNGTTEALDQYPSVSRFCGNVKKYYRDGKAIPAELATGVLTKVYNYYMYPTMKVHAITLDEVLQTNFDKLTKRKENNTIQGDGDKR